MSYDMELAGRIRMLLDCQAGVTEKAKFGGLGFLVDGAMAVAARRGGGILVRVDPAEAGAAVRERGAAPAVMRGRTLSGWITVEGGVLDDEKSLAAWVERGVACALSHARE